MPLKGPLRISTLSPIEKLSLVKHCQSFVVNYPSCRHPSLQPAHQNSQDATHLLKNELGTSFTLRQDSTAQIDTSGT
jgi:hypothetical protein